MSNIEKSEPERTTKLKRLVRSRYGLLILGLISFVESSLVVPIIVDPFLMLYVLSHRSRTTAAVAVTVVASVLGGVVAFLIAYFFQSLIFLVIDPTVMDIANPFIERFRDQTFLLTLIGSIVPLPYTIVAMAAGFMKGNISMFILGSLLGRAVRFGFVGYLIYLVGARATVHLQRQLIILAGLILVGIIIYAVWP